MNIEITAIWSGCFSQLVTDVRTALHDGQVQVDSFLQERVFTKATSLMVAIHRNKRLNFAKDQTNTPANAAIKVAQMEKTGLATLIDIAERSGIINLDSVLEGGLRMSVSRCIMWMVQCAKQVRVSYYKNLH
jgi:hypothetical protein